GASRPRGNRGTRTLRGLSVRPARRSVSREARLANTRAQPAAGNPGNGSCQAGRGRSGRGARAHTRWRSAAGRPIELEPVATTTEAAHCGSQPLSASESPCQTFREREGWALNDLSADTCTSATAGRPEYTHQRRRAGPLTPRDTRQLIKMTGR